MASGCPLTFDPPKEKLERSKWGPTNTYDVPEDMVDITKIKLTQVKIILSTKKIEIGHNKPKSPTQLEVDLTLTIPSRISNIIATPTPLTLEVIFTITPFGNIVHLQLIIERCSEGNQ